VGLNFYFNKKYNKTNILQGILAVLSDQWESVSALRSKGRALLASRHEQLPLSQGGGA
jgi:hypothetical protein